MQYTRYARSALGLALGFSAAALVTPAAHAQVPSGWQAFTDGTADYTIRSDVGRRDGGQGYAGVTIKSNVESPRGTGMLAQSIRADAYRGKRVRLSGYLKGIGISEGTAELWMRVDGDGVVQTSDYMQDRPLMGTRDWKREEIVLDVPTNAIGITFGFLLSGTGQVWLDDLQVEIVSDDAPVTGKKGGLYPDADTRYSATELIKRRRDQEVAYRRLSAEPLNLALRQNVSGMTVAAVVRAP
jgi:hypothetical protein